MRGAVRKWGNSASVRIPAAVMDAARFRLDQTVDIREEDGRIVIEPIAIGSNDIDALVDAITEENLHKPIEMGPAVGQEVW